MKLLRKISLAKWKKSLEVGLEHVSADALTGCLRTQGNTLSVWKWETVDEYNDSLLALLAAQTKIDKIDVINIDVEDLARVDIATVLVRGDTAAEAYADNHLDIVDLNYLSLKDVADIVKGEVAQDRQTPVSKKQFTEFIVEGVKQGKIKYSLLHEDMRAQVGILIPDNFKL